jgi:oligoendopeptidase F
LGPQRAAAQCRQKLIGWDEAKGIVLDAYQRFSPEMADIGRRFFDENWIDAPSREGKSPGAFSHPTVPSAHPLYLAQLSRPHARCDDPCP